MIDNTTSNGTLISEAMTLARKLNRCNCKIRSLNTQKDELSGKIVEELIDRFLYQVMTPNVVQMVAEIDRLAEFRERDEAIEEAMYELSKDKEPESIQERWLRYGKE
jgi:hypothetical protein